MRIVSLLASATEIVCALGLRRSLVGRSHECDYPRDIAELPACTQPAFATEGGSAEIDRAVRRAAGQALSIYRVNEDRLAELRPDVIVTQTQCEVCAVSLKDVEAAVAGSLRGCRVLAVSPNRVSDVYDDVKRLAAALGAPGPGFELVVSMKRRLAELAARAAMEAFRPRIACLEWIEPMMSAGHWMPELVAAAGGVDVFGEPGGRGQWLSWERLLDADPDVLFIAPCGFPLYKTRENMGPLTRRPEWEKLKAVRAGRVYMGDGNQYFSRPGPRLVESAECLAEILHPSAFHFGHDGPGWRRYAAASESGTASKTS